jgi:hypothetical protein
MQEGMGGKYRAETISQRSDDINTPLILVLDKRHDIIE